MSRHFLAYWQPKEHDKALRRGRPLTYAASNQYSRVEPGDTVWIVSIRDGSLRLIGRMLVDQVCDREAAKTILDEDDLYPAKYYVIPATESVRMAKDIDIHHLVPRLRFESKKDHLEVDQNGHLHGGQLQSIRRLTEDSTVLLATALGL